jgi:hypothetical protein
MEIAGNYLYSDLERVVSLFWGRRLEGKETSSVGALGVNDKVTDLTIHVAAGRQHINPGSGEQWRTGLHSARQ